MKSLSLSLTVGPGAYCFGRQLEIVKRKVETKGQSLFVKNYQIPKMLNKGEDNDC